MDPNKSVLLTSLNVQGLAKVEKLMAVFSNIKTNIEFVLCFQETKMTYLPRTHINVLTHYRCKYFLEPAHKNNGGLLIVYSASLECKLVKACPYFQLISSSKCKMNIGNIYIRSRDFSNCLTQVKSLLNQVDTNDPLTILGDFNAMKDKSWTTSNAVLNHDARLYHYKKLYQEIFAAYNLNDVGEFANNFEKTHFDQKVLSRSRIDFIMSNSAQHFSRFAVHEFALSDHSLVQAIYNCEVTEPRGTSFWKLNDRILLQNKESISAFIHDYNISGNPTSKNYDNLKSELRHLLRFASIIKLKCDNSCLRVLRTRLNSALSCDDLLLAYKLKSELCSLELDKAHNKLKNLREFYNDINGGSSAAVKRRLKINNPTNNMTSLLSDVNVQLNGTDEIINAFVDHYRNLYAKPQNSPELNDFISKPAPFKLGRKQRKLLSRPFTEAEFEKAIHKLNPKSSPGPDGLTSNFYKLFKREFGSILCTLVNNSELEHLPYSMSMAIIKLIPKGTQPKFTSDFRPISLINTDQKIISHVLANRLIEAFNSILSVSQYAYLTNRKMLTANFLVKILKSKLSKNRCLVALDFSKAFDKLNRDYLFNLLTKVGVHDNITNLIKKLYKKNTSMIEVNGHLSAPIDINRGVRQGDPLSALLFIISIEPMIKNIQNCVQIKSLVGRKVIGYADDLICMTKTSSLETFFDVVQSFCDISSLELNKSKCKIISHKRKHSKVFKHLGINYDLNLPNNDKISEVELVKMKHKFVMPKMSYRGKAIVMDVFIVSQIVFKARNQNFSPQYIASSQKIITNGLWNDGFHDINEKILTLPTTLGGVGLPDISLKIATAKLIDYRNILCDKNDLELSSFLINAINMKNDENVAGDLKFFKRTKIDVIYASVDGIDIRYCDERYSIEQNTKSAELYFFMIKHKSVLAEQRLIKSEQRFGIPIKDLICFSKFLWSSKSLKAYQKNILYRLLYLGTKDRLWLFSKGLRDSPKCIFCNAHNETFEHLFFNCSFLSSLVGVARPKCWNEIFDKNNLIAHSFVCIIIMASWTESSAEAFEKLEDLKTILRCK